MGKGKRCCQLAVCFGERGGEEREFVRPGWIMYDFDALLGGVK